MLEPAAEGGGILRASLRIGGRSLGRHQLDLALALGCERVVCIAPALDAELLELQHLTESKGARFHVISGPRALLGLVTAADEIIALGDGLFVSGPIQTLLEAGPAIVVQSVESGLAAGFERIDLSHAAAGALRVPGRLVAQLADAPPDCDLLSTLQRLALQAGVTRKELPSLEPGEFWLQVRSDAEAHAVEPAWVRQRLGPADGWTGPGHWLALQGVRRFGAGLLDAGGGSRALLIGAIVLIALGFGAGWFGLGLLGMGFCGLGWIAAQAYRSLARIERGPDAGNRSTGLVGWGIDAVLVALLGWSAGAHHGMFEVDRYFPPLMLLTLLRLVPRALRADWTNLFNDRLLLLTLLGTATAFGETGLVVHGFAVIIALAGLLVPRGDFQLTRP